MLRALGAVHQTNTLAKPEDMAFVKDDFWLPDTAVIEVLVKRQGAWEIHLLFAHSSSPFTFLCRRITAMSCKKKAELTASLMRRLAAKDQRGTLRVDISHFGLVYN